ncbi:MAG: multicopper oxidase domain-containing protein [Nakamurella sp.]
MATRRSTSTRTWIFLVTIVIAGQLTACTSDEPSTPSTTAVSGGNAGPDGTPVGYREPVKLSSRDGVLEVRLSAHQGTVPLDTVAEPVSNFLVYGYQLIKGTASDGSVEGDNNYPAPTLHVEPGEQLIVHYDNDLQDLSIQDFYDPAFTSTDAAVPIYPPALTSAPLNLHTHGLHVSPDGNADNVLLDIPAGMSNTYDYAVPTDMPNGLYWYHSHRHTLTAQETYLGLAGLLEIGRADGNLPVVTANHIPIRDMALQSNYVFDRQGGGHQLNDPNWPQYVSTLQPPVGSQLADGSYSPSLAPVNFAGTSLGAEFMTNWYAGPLSPANHRGQNQFIPSNLQSFSSESKNVPADPTRPENERDVQFTINGLFQPELKLKPGQTEIWVLANISDFAYMPIRLTETATGKHPSFSIVGQDGNPFAKVQSPVDGDGTRLVIPPASRYAIAVTMPDTGDLVLDMPPEKGAPSVTNPGVLYTNNGSTNPPAVLGTVTVQPEHISYTDGFFTFPTQTLLRISPDDGAGRTTIFEPGQDLGAYTSFVDTSALTPDVTRELTVSGGFGNEKASTSDPKAFTYEFDANTFPNIPLIQPRLNSVEEWKITNLNNDEHPMHIHVNDFQVTQIVDPVAGTMTGVQPWGEDNVNVPAPVTDTDESALEPASVTVRTKFTEYTGTFVIHCHRLNHEDNGLMAIVNVIPEVSSYGIAVSGRPGRPATVQVYSGDGEQTIATVTPFPSFDGSPTIAMADIDGDMVLDLVVGSGAGIPSEVVAYSGAAGSDGPFRTELVRFSPFNADFVGGVTVAGADIDGNALADNIIVGSGPGIESQIKVFSAIRPDQPAPDIFSTFTPYPGSQTGVTIATGMVDAESGRSSIVVAPGPGDPAQIKAFRYDLYVPTARARAADLTHQHDSSTREPTMTAEFLAYDATYTAGVSLATGWVVGAEGGAQSIVTGQLGGDGGVRVWSSGSRLDGEPAMYLESPNHHAASIEFHQIASFAPVPGAGVTVATTSTTTGADLLVGAAGSTGQQVSRFGLGRPDPQATTVTPTLLSEMPVLDGGTEPAPLAGR